MKSPISRRFALQVLAGVVVSALWVFVPSMTTHAKTKPQAKPKTTFRVAPNVMLAGVWQAAPVMGAGWANTYQIFSDGRVIFHASQMDCQSRLRGWSGRYKLQSGKITFAITREIRHSGGVLVKSSGSCGTPLELRGGREITRRLRRARSQTLGFKGVRADESNGRPMTILGQERLWKFGNQAQNYP